MNLDVFVVGEDGQLLTTWWFDGKKIWGDETQGKQRHACQAGRLICTWCAPLARLFIILLSSYRQMDLSLQHSHSPTYRLVVEELLVLLQPLGDLIYLSSSFPEQCASCCASCRSNVELDLYACTISQSVRLLCRWTDCGSGPHLSQFGPVCHGPGWSAHDKWWNDNGWGPAGELLYLSGQHQTCLQLCLGLWTVQGASQQDKVSENIQ